MTSRWRSRSSLWLVIALLAVTSTLLIGGLSYGLYRTSTLSLATCQPASNAGQTVQVALVDGGGMMGPSLMMLELSPSPTSVPAGRVTFVATNYGRLNHQFLVSPWHTSVSERREAFVASFHLHNHHRSRSPLGGASPISRVNTTGLGITASRVFVSAALRGCQRRRPRATMHRFATA